MVGDASPVAASAAAASAMTSASPCGPATPRQLDAGLDQLALSARAALEPHDRALVAQAHGARLVAKPRGDEPRDLRRDVGPQRHHLPRARLDEADGRRAPRVPSPSASTSSYSNAGVMTRANPQRSKTPSSVSAMRRRAAAARGAKSRIPVGSRKVEVQSLGRGSRWAHDAALDGVPDDSVLQVSDEHLGQLDRDLLLRLARRRAQVRAGDQVLVREQRRRLRRLLAEHVQRRARELPRLQRLQHAPLR